MPDPDYSLVEHLLYDGFLTKELIAGSIPVVLKSMNNQELRMVDFRQPSTEQWKDRAGWMLAYSTFTFNGQNILSDRSRYLPHLQRGYKKLPTHLFVHLISHVRELNERAAQQAEYVEPYVYGDFSRRQWKMMRNSLPCDQQNTGIPGTDEIGMNTHQNLWVFFNRVLDTEEDFRRNWNVGRFVASAFNSKGVKKATRKVDSRREEIEEERKALYEGRGEKTFDEKGRIEIVDESPEELLDQIERTIEGEQDFHDKVIEQYEDRIRSQHASKTKQRQQARQEMQKEVQKQRARRDEVKPYQEYDPEEVEKELHQVDQQRAERLQEAPPKQQSDHHQDRTADKFRKWGIIPNEDENPDEVFDHPMLEDDYHTGNSEE